MSATDEIRDELRKRTDERGTKYSAQFDETQAIELASGYVSAEVQAIFLSMLSWMDEDRRASARLVADKAKAARRIKS